MSRRLLIIEDDPTALEYVARGFEQEGWTAERARDGRDGLYLATSGDFELIVLDRNLPGMEGLAVLKALRAAGNETPVIILSALAHVDERVRGLRAGGDDYVVKPFAFSELSARADALLRRKAPAAVQTTLTCGGLVVDLVARRVTRDGKPLDLLPREFKLLEYLLRHKDQIVTRTMLLEGVWDYRFDPHTNIIDTHISRLRKKLEDGFEHPLLHTVRGVGYRLSETP